MRALPKGQAAIAAKLPGRPAKAEPRDCVAYARLTTGEYEALCSLVPRGATLSDFCRELLSEAVLSRLRRGAAQPVASASV